MLSTTLSAQQRDIQAAVIANRKRYAVRSKVSPWDINIQTGRWFSATWAVNKTPEEIYIYPAKSRYNEPYDRIPTAFKEGVLTGGEPILIIRCTNHSGNYQNIYSNGAYTPQLETDVTEIVVTYRELLEDAVYIKEIDMVVAIDAHKDRLEYVYPHSTKFLDQLREKAAFSWYNEHTDAPVVVAANDPTGRAQELFLVINGSTITAPVKCEPSLDPFVEIRLFYRGKMDIIKCNPAEVFDKFQIFTHNDSCWVLGKGEFHVKEAYQKFIREKQSGITEEDVNAKCKNIITPYQTKIETLTKTIDIQKREITNLKCIVDDHTKGVKATHDERKWDHETKTLERQSELEFRNKYLEENIALMKYEKERHSTVASEMGMWTNVIKGAVVIVPILASIYVAMKSSVAIATVATVSVVASAIASTWSMITSFW